MSRRSWRCRQNRTGGLARRGRSGAARTYAAIVHTGVDVPATRKTRGKFEVVQMIGEDVNGTDEPEALPLN